MPVTSLSIGSLTASSGSLSGNVTLTGTPSYPYIVDFLVNDVTSNTALAAGSTFTSSSVIITSPDTSANFTISGLTNGTQYSVIAYDINGVVSAAQIGTPSSVPLRPVLLVVSTDETNVKLLIDYGASQGSDCLQYPLFYKAVDASTIQTFAVPAFSYSGKSAPFTQSITITSLQMGTQYEFALNTKNAVGLSPLSNTVIATPSDVAGAPGVPTLTKVVPDATHMAAVQSTISMPTDWANFTTFDPSNNTAFPVAKFILFSDFSVDGTITSLQHTLVATVSATDANGTQHYSGAFTVSPVTLPISATSTKSLVVTAKGRSKMNTGNDNNIIDQSSAASGIMYVAGNVGLADAANLSPLQIGNDMSSSGSNIQLAVKAYYHQSPPTLTGYTNYIRVAGASDDQVQSLVSAPAAQQFPLTLLGDATPLNFQVGVSDFGKSAKFQVQSRFFALDGVTTISTRWSTVTTYPAFSLYTQPDALAITVRDSEQLGQSAFQISTTIPTTLQMRGLYIRDYLLSVKPTTGTGSSTWLEYPAITTSTFDGNVYQKYLPGAGGAFVPGNSYDFIWKVRGSVLPTSTTLITGVGSSMVSGVIGPNAFKVLTNCYTKSNLSIILTYYIFVKIVFDLCWV